MCFYYLRLRKVPLGIFFKYVSGISGRTSEKSLNRIFNVFVELSIFHNVADIPNVRLEVFHLNIRPHLARPQFGPNRSTQVATLDGVSTCTLRMREVVLLGMASGGLPHLGCKLWFSPLASTADLPDADCRT